MQVLQAQSITKTALLLKNVIGMFTLQGSKVHNNLYGSPSCSPACFLVEYNFISSSLVQSTKFSFFPQNYFIYFKETLNNSLKACLCTLEPIHVLRMENVLTPKV